MYFLAIIVYFLCGLSFAEERIDFLPNQQAAEAPAVTEIYIDRMIRRLGCVIGELQSSNPLLARLRELCSTGHISQVANPFLCPFVGPDDGHSSIYIPFERSGSIYFYHSQLPWGHIRQQRGSITYVPRATTEAPGNMSPYNIFLGQMPWTFTQDSRTLIAQLGQLHELFSIMFPYIDIRRILVLFGEENRGISAFIDVMIPTEQQQEMDLLIQRANHSYYKFGSMWLRLDQEGKEFIQKEFAPYMSHHQLGPKGPLVIEKGRSIVRNSGGQPNRNRHYWH